MAPHISRSFWKFFMTERKPSFSRPSRFDAGIRQSSKISSAVSEDSQPVFFSARPTRNPGVPLSTMNIEIPCEPRASRLVLAATKYTSACTPLVMNILLPLSTNPSPARSARVRMPATSDPASGSVTATAVIVSPLTMPGM